MIKSVKKMMKKHENLKNDKKLKKYENDEKA